MRFVIFLLTCCLINCGSTLTVKRVKAPENLTPQVILINPSNELAALSETATARWWNSTGIDITTSIIGIPVTIEDDHVLNVNGVQYRALTMFKDGNPVAIKIARYRYEMGQQATLDTLTHEYGHLLRLFRHMNTGVMKDQTLLGDKITKGNVNAVCLFNDCLWKHAE